MIGYITLGTNDLARAANFYDAVLGELGATRTRQTPHSITWQIAPGQPALCLIKPYDGLPATRGNGAMVALYAATPDRVRSVHATAVAQGANDEGAVGPRDSVPGFYAGYFRDLDGNKLNVFCFSQPSKDD